MKFVILTSHVNEHVINKAMKMGIYGYILKDINSEFLDMIVKSVSNGAMWIDRKVVQILRELNPNVINFIGFCKFIFLKISISISPFNIKY